jgi:DNA mismatch repair ATPase MutS
VPIHFWLFVLVANYAWTWMAKGALEAEMERMSAREGAFSGYAELLRLVADREFTAPGLQAIRSRLAASGLDAAAELARLHRLSELSDVRHSSVHTLLQAAMAWDLLLLERVAAWQRRAGRFTGEWLAAMGELEVLGAFAGIRFDHPDWAFADIDPAAETLTAAGLGHPLLPDAARVGNDVEIGPAGRLLLVTGSNMSGKSTLLRAIGVNALLAQAGAPVCAAALRMPQLAVETSGRIDDSLVEGVSFFLAELQRLQTIVAAASAALAAGTPRVLFLLDEILRGTNSEERRVAVAKIVERLLASGAIGAVSTHDLEIARVPALSGHLHNVHFRETLTAGTEGPAMSFDYRLREGLATTTNALVLLRLVGLDGPPDGPGNRPPAPHTIPSGRTRDPR